MQYLAWMGNATSGTVDDSDETGQPSVEQKVAIPKNLLRLAWLDN
jgi:hypothetical protein